MAKVLTNPKVVDPIGLFKRTVQEYAQPTAQSAAAKAVSERHGFKPTAMPAEEQQRLARRRSVMTQARRRGRASTTAMSGTLG